MVSRKKSDDSGFPYLPYGQLSPCKHASDWRLDPLVFEVFQSFWPSIVDLFSASWYKQLDYFVSWKHQPDALALDKLSLNWRWMRGSSFPLFCLIARCLSKIRRDKATVKLTDGHYSGLSNLCELASIEWASLRFRDEDLLFTFSRPKKSQTSGPLASCQVKPFVNDRQICPVSCMSEYLKQATAIRDAKQLNF